MKHGVCEIDCKSNVADWKDSSSLGRFLSDSFSYFALLLLCKCFSRDNISLGVSVGAEYKLCTDLFSVCGNPGYSPF